MKISAEKITTELEKLKVKRMSNEEANKITRHSLQKALMKLMNEKDFADISITELVQHSGVSRPSFYRNYKNKEAILEDICQEIGKALQNSLQEERFQEDFRAWYLYVFETIRKEEALLRLLIKANMPLKIDIGIDPEMEPNATEEERKAFYDIVCVKSAFFTAVYEWFQRGLVETDAFMADYCYYRFGDVFHQYVQQRK